MIMGILNNYTEFYLKDIIKGGVERLLLIIPEEEVNSLKQDLQVLGEIRYFKVWRIELDSFIPTFFDLSDQERNAVIEAVKRGYYDYPGLGSQPRQWEPHRTPHIAHRVHCRALFYTAKIINFRGKKDRNDK